MRASTFKGVDQGNRALIILPITCVCNQLDYLS